MLVITHIVPQPFLNRPYTGANLFSDIVEAASLPGLLDPKGKVFQSIIRFLIQAEFLFFLKLCHDLCGFCQGLAGPRSWYGLSSPVSVK